MYEGRRECVVNVDVLERVVMLKRRQQLPLTVAFLFPSRSDQGNQDNLPWATVMSKVCDIIVNLYYSGLVAWGLD